MAASTSTIWSINSYQACTAHVLHCNGKPNKSLKALWPLLIKNRMMLCSNQNSSSSHLPAALASLSISAPKCHCTWQNCKGTWHKWLLQQEDLATLSKSIPHYTIPVTTNRNWPVLDSERRETIEDVTTQKSLRLAFLTAISSNDFWPSHILRAS